jgi:syntaxin 1B/2/3
MSGTDNISGFLNETTEIEQTITNAKTNIARIQEFQVQILNSTSTTQEDVTIKERERLIFNTRNLLVECKDRIRNIQYDNARLSSTDPNFGIRQQRFEYLRTKLSSVLEEYRQAESNFMKQTKDRMARQYKVVNPNATQQEIDDYVSNSDSQPIFQQALLRTNEAKSALAEVQKRHEDIKNIENTIAELVTLFQELHLQVEAQDQTIVSIVDNAESTAEKTGKTAEDLGKANKLAASARKKKWICLGIALLIIIVIVVVLVIRFLPSNSGSSKPAATTTSPTTPALSNNPPVNQSPQSPKLMFL